MADLGLAETIQALREELEGAVAQSGDEQIRFLVGPVEVEFQIAVKREGSAGGKARFWVIEAGAEGKVGRESVQRVKLTLEPAGKDGGPVQVQRGFDERP
jgi:hypothetical protein